jgi:hypothetical protein
MVKKWHNKHGARIINPGPFSYDKKEIDCPPKPFHETTQIVVGEHPTQNDESDDIEAAKTIRQKREEKSEELLHKIKTYSEEDKYN